MQRRHCLSFVMMVGLILSIAGCSGDLPVSPKTTASALDQIDTATTPVAQRDVRIFMGPASPIGDGTARTWVELSPSGTPLAAGLTLSDDALESLPSEPTSWVLPFHRKASTTPFTHVLIGYNPHGHEPPGVYDLPHFDMHFYMIPSAVRMEIGPADPGFDILPASQYIPDFYMRIPGGVPQMGTHWIDLLAPEFNGQTFTRTYIWGTFDGKVIFFEPMITLGYLESEPSETIPLRQPQAYQRDGYYPTSYRVEYREHPDRYEISLQGLEFHPGQ